MTTTSHNHSFLTPPKRPRFDVLAPLRHWIDHIEVTDETFAHRICHWIPCQCPFERNIAILGRTFHIPPMCKLNPLYDELIGLRLRALAFLADDCGVDVRQYLC